MTRFAARLGAAMAERGWTPRDVADRAGLSANTVRKWLGGRGMPSEGSLERVCDATGLSPQALGMPGGGRQPVGLPSKRAMSVRELIVRMSDEGRVEAEIGQALKLPGKVVSRVLRQARATPREVTPAPKDCVPEWLRATMAAPSYESVRCPICGSPGPLERHHLVRRSQGGSKGPTVTLCHDCHMAVHAQRLHIRWVPVARTVYGLAYGCSGGHYEYLRREGSTFELMDEPGWRRFNARRD